MTTEEASRRQQLNRIGDMWPNGWTKRLHHEYTQALNDLSPDQLEQAVTTAIRTNTYRPTPAQLRETTQPKTKDGTMGRDIDPGPRYQHPDEMGIRPYIHDAVALARRLQPGDGIPYLQTVLTDTIDPPTVPEQHHLENAISQLKEAAAS